MLGVQFSISELREARTFQTATAIINATAGALTVILAVQSKEELRPCLKEVGNFQLCCTAHRPLDRQNKAIAFAAAFQPEHHRERDQIESRAQLKRLTVTVGGVVKIASNQRPKCCRRARKSEDEPDDRTDREPAKKVANQGWKERRHSPVRKPERPLRCITAQCRC